MSQQNLQPMDERRHILIVDDHADIRRSVAAYLSREGFQCGTADCARAMDAYLVQHSVDLIILDVMMPGEDGLSICKRLTSSQDLPILMLSALDSSEDAIAGLDLGADDYLAKPFEPKELILRIKNILTKTIKTDQKRIIEFENVKIDLNKLLIIKNKKEFKINNTEKIILEKMINNPGNTFSRESIGQLINLDKERSIDVIITRLRKKIEIDPKNPKFLQTIRGAGYVLWIE